jgi:hypothetical protein
MVENLARFARALYFDIQSIDGVKPLEIWNGLRELDEPFEKASLIKNLCKIVAPLVNEECFDRASSDHAGAVARSVRALYDGLCKDPQTLIFKGFPDPPVRDAEQKGLYRAVKSEASAAVKRVIASARRKGRIPAPDRLFDFRELRVIDNELPYIIFTDKEFRVIHGLVLVYLWIIDIPSTFVSLLRETGVGVEIPQKLEELSDSIVKENPLLIRGKKTSPRALVSKLDEKLKEGDYLDMFESVYRWFEELKERLSPRSEPGK